VGWVTWIYHGTISEWQEGTIKILLHLVPLVVDKKNPLRYCLERRGRGLQEELFYG